MSTKSWYTSKTVWFNALTIVLAVATFGFSPDPIPQFKATASLGDFFRTIQ